MERPCLWWKEALSPNDGKSALIRLRFCLGLTAIGGRSELQDTIYQESAFLIGLAAFLIRPAAFFIGPALNLVSSLAFLIRPPFSRFSGQSFSAQHNVERDTSGPTGNGPVGKHLVHQVKAETLLQPVPIAFNGPDRLRVSRFRRKVPDHPCCCNRQQGK